MSEWIGAARLLLWNWDGFIGTTSTLINYAIIALLIHHWFF